jgi:serine/threonine protein kinase
MFYLLSGRKPFECEDNFELFEMIKQGDFEMSGKVWNEVSNEGKDLLMRILVVDPAKRINAEGIAQHPWI